MKGHIRACILASALVFVVTYPSVTRAADPGVARKGLACVGSGAPSEQYACLEHLHSNVSQNVVTKTNAFISIATISCAHDVYVEWEDSLNELADLWQVVHTQVTAAKSTTYSQVIRKIEMEILDSRFAVADAALHNGGRYCRKYADAEYRRILQDYRDPAFGFARDRARVGIDDVRALPPLSTE